MTSANSYLTSCSASDSTLTLPDIALIPFLPPYISAQQGMAVCLGDHVITVCYQSRHWCEDTILLINLVYGSTF